MIAAVGYAFSQIYIRANPIHEGRRKVFRKKNTLFIAGWLARCVCNNYSKWYT